MCTLAYSSHLDKSYGREKAQDKKKRLLELISEFQEQTRFTTTSPSGRQSSFSFPKFPLQILPGSFFSSLAARSRAPEPPHAVPLGSCLLCPSVPAGRCCRDAQICSVSPDQSSLACSSSPDWTRQHLLSGASPHRAPSLPPQMLRKGVGPRTCPCPRRWQSHPGDNCALGQERADRRQICRLRSQVPDPPPLPRYG